MHAATLATRDGPFAGMESIDAKGSFPKTIGSSRHRWNLTGYLRDGYPGDLTTAISMTSIQK